MHTLDGRPATFHEGLKRIIFMAQAIPGSHNNSSNVLCKRLREIQNQQRIDQETIKLNKGQFVYGYLIVVAPDQTETEDKL